MLTKSQIDRVMRKLGYRATYDNGRRKIWSTSQPPRSGAASHLDVRYPIARSDLERVLIDQGVIGPPEELDSLLG